MNQQDEVFEKLDKEYLQDLLDQIGQLHISREMFRHLREVVTTYPRLNKKHVVLDWIFRNYGVAMMLGLRRMIDSGPGSKNALSFVRLLEIIQKNPEVISRERFRKAYKGKERGDYEFKIAVPENKDGKIDPAAVQNEIDELLIAIGPIADFVDKYIAHQDRDRSDGTYTYSWDYENRLTGITGGGLTASHSYDYDGRRKSKTVNGVTTTYLYDQENLIREISATAADYLFGPAIDEPLAQSIGGTISYYDVDALGSAIALNDAVGTIQNSYTYDSWGVLRNQTGSTPNNFGYTSREFAEAGLYFYRARYYPSPIGRFNSEDPLRFGGWSMYAYVANSPAFFKDPSGMILFPPSPAGPGWVMKCYECASKLYKDGREMFPKPTRHNHMRHCWTSCEVTKRCGSECFWIVSIGNEFLQIKPKDNVEDITANSKGHDIALKGGDCIDGCAECKPGAGGPPSSPPPPPPPADK